MDDHEIVQNARLKADQIIQQGENNLNTIYAPIAGGTAITTVGTIGTGGWNGDVISSSKLDADTAHLTTDQTFTGNKTFSTAITASSNISSSGDIQTAYTGSFGHVVASSVSGLQSGKQYRIINCSFRDDIGTTKHYLPLKSQDEQTALTREEATELAVCDGRVVSVTYRGEQFGDHSGDATVTFGVETNAVGSAYASGFSEVETEAVTVNDADDQHLFHAVFSSSKHWDSTDMFAISIVASEDITGTNERHFITVVVEDDWSTYLAGSTREIDSTP